MRLLQKIQLTSTGIFWKFNNWYQNNLIVFRHLSGAVIKVLDYVARNMKSDSEINDFLTKLLGLFSQLGIKVKEMNDKVTNSDKIIVKVSFSMLNFHSQNILIY